MSPGRRKGVLWCEGWRSTWDMSQVCFRLTCGCMRLIIYCSLIGVGTVMILISSGDLLPQDFYSGGAVPRTLFGGYDERVAATVCIVLYFTVQYSYLVGRGVGFPEFIAEFDFLFCITGDLW